MVSHLDNFWENFWKIFLKNRTTVYKAGLSKLEDWKNFFILKFSKIKKLYLQFFEKIGDVFLHFLSILKVARTGYFVIFFVTRFFQSSSVLKPALYTVV